MIVNNRVCKLLGTEYPLLQGGMAWVADAALAAAVSNAGGIGIIAAAATPPEILDQEILKAKGLTDRPFGLNIMLMSPTASDALELAARHRLPIVTTGAGSPGKVLERLKPLGTIVVPVVASVSQARRVEKQGADAVVAEGMEAGGHIGELTTMVLVPQIAGAVKIPVIAAGGIGDSRGICAAFSLGAKAVQMGSRFVLSKECIAHENYKNMVLKARDRSTVITGRATGHPARVLQNKLSRIYLDRESHGAPIEELEKLGLGTLRLAAREGDVEMGSVMIGQISGMLSEIESVEDIIQNLVKGIPHVLEAVQENLR